MATEEADGLRAGYLQFSPVFGDIGANLERVLNGLGRVEADLIVLPELPFTGYGFESREELLTMAEDPNRSGTVEALVGLCDRRDLNIVTGFAELCGEHCYNSALLLGPKGIEARYRKLHLFNREKLYFDPGDTPPVTARVRDAMIGMMICFDWSFPEMARSLTLMGAEILCHPANLVLDLCQNAMVTRCVENRVYAVTANRTGMEERAFGSLEFTGRSQVVDPDGRILHRGPLGDDETWCTRLELSSARDKSMTPGNNILSDRRPELYRL